jgi:hypothetical protein
MLVDTLKSIMNTLVIVDKEITKDPRGFRDQLVALGADPEIAQKLAEAAIHKPSIIYLWELCSENRNLRVLLRQYIESKHTAS